MRWTSRLWRDPMPETKLTVTVREQQDGSLWAEVKEFPGCCASGGSMEELQEALAQAISPHFCEPGARAPVRFWHKIGEVEGEPEPEPDPDRRIDVLVS